MSIKQSRVPANHPGGPIVTRGRSDLSSLKCPVGGCEGYAVPTGKDAKGNPVLRCGKCQRQISTKKF